MSSRTLFVAGTLFAGLLAGSVPAQSVSLVTSADDISEDGFVNAAVGTELTITGDTLGDKKPKAWLQTGEGKKYSLKVTEFDATHIKATIKKAVLGDLTLFVQPKGVEAIDAGSVTIEAPVITEVQTISDGEVPSVSPAEEFVLVGAYFGHKTGKIFVGGKKAKGLSWLNDTIHVLMPTKLANGLWDILLDNKLDTNDDFDITMINSNVKVGKVGLTVTLGSETIKFKYSAGAQTPGIVAFGGTNGSFPVKVFTFVFPFNIESDEVPATIDSDDSTMIITFTQTEKPLLPPHIATWLLGPGAPGLIINVNASGGGQIGGNFEGDLPQVTSTLEHATDDPLHISGTFVFETP